ncbi:MAG: hypothetical protein JWO67_6318, partial [Streptosporangiaceae bacterium]|nr:hypothetical protein [Streptosporangiaceae bacterium]
MLTDQRAVLRRIEQLAAGQEWRQDRRAAWVAILRRLVYSMDRQTGLVTGVPAATLAAAGGRSERTVSDVIRWAKDAGLVFTVEEGAAADFLQSRVNRCPTYAFLVDRLAPAGSSNDGADQGRELLCDLSLSCVGTKPLQGRGLDRSINHPSWPLWRVPEKAEERGQATRTVRSRLGLDRPGPDRWRIGPLLDRWWAAGWCPAALLHAIDHHPDR